MVYEIILYKCLGYAWWQQDFLETDYAIGCRISCAEDSNGHNQRLSWLITGLSNHYLFTFRGQLAIIWSVPDPNPTNYKHVLRMNFETERKWENEPFRMMKQFGWHILWKIMLAIIVLGKSYEYHVTLKLNYNRCVFEPIWIFLSPSIFCKIVNPFHEVRLMVYIGLNTT